MTRTATAAPPKRSHQQFQALASAVPNARISSSKRSHQQCHPHQTKFASKHKCRRFHKSLRLSLTGPQHLWRLLAQRVAALKRQRVKCLLKRFVGLREHQLGCVVTIGALVGSHPALGRLFSGKWWSVWVQRCRSVSTHSQFKARTRTLRNFQRIHSVSSGTRWR
jgi:hypothetical protein